MITELVLSRTDNEMDIVGAVFVGTEMQVFTANRNHAVSEESLRNLEFGTGEVLVRHD